MTVASEWGAAGLEERTLHTAEVCIVGDGVIGKTLALALGQAGISVLLLRAAMPAVRMPAATFDARVYALNRTAQQVLQSVRVWDALDPARVTPVQAMVVREGAQAALHFSADQVQAEALAYIVEEHQLQRTLDVALGFAPQVRVLSGRAEALEVQSDTAILRVSEGRRLAAALVVGADGAQSWVRAQADIDFALRLYHQQGVVCHFHCASGHRNTAFQWFLPGQGVLALLPLPGDVLSLVWSAPDALAATLLREGAAALAGRVQEVAAQAGVQGLTPLADSVPQAFPLRLLRVAHPVAARVALVGDAAHGVHPLSGHGLNLGFADVAALLTCLKTRPAGVECGEPTLLARYVRMRKEEVLKMQALTDVLARMYAQQGAGDTPLARMRQWGMQMVDQWDWAKSHLVRAAMGELF